MRLVFFVLHFFLVFFTMLLLSQRKKIKTFITKILNFEAEKTFYKPKIACLGHYTSFVFPKRKKKFHIQPGCIITQVLKEILSPFCGQRGTSSDHQTDLSKLET